MTVQRQTKASKTEFIKGHFKSFTIAIFSFLIKENNIPLIINLLYHSTRASLIKSNKRSTKDRGILHLSLALLSALAIGKRKIVSKRSAFLVLSASGVGHVLNFHDWLTIMVSMTSLIGWSVTVQQTGRFF